jgi:hypothetical protein
MGSFTFFPVLGEGPKQKKSAAKPNELELDSTRNKRNALFFIIAPWGNQLGISFRKKGGENRDSPPTKNKQKAL